MSDIQSLVQQQAANTDIGLTTSLWQVAGKGQGVVGTCGGAACAQIYYDNPLPFPIAGALQDYEGPNANCKAATSPWTVGALGTINAQNVQGAGHYAYWSPYGGANPNSLPTPFSYYYPMTFPFSNPMWASPLGPPGNYNWPYPPPIQQCFTSALISPPSITGHSSSWCPMYITVDGNYEIDPTATCTDYWNGLVTEFKDALMFLAAGGYYSPFGFNNPPLQSVPSSDPTTHCYAMMAGKGTFAGVGGTTVDQRIINTEQVPACFYYNGGWVMLQYGPCYNWQTGPNYYEGSVPFADLEGVILNLVDYNDITGGLLLSGCICNASPPTPMPMPGVSPPDNLYRDLCVSAAPLPYPVFDPQSGELLSSDKRFRFNASGQVSGSKPLILMAPAPAPFPAGPTCMPMKNTPLNPLTIHPDSTDTLAYAFAWFENIGNRTTAADVKQLGRLYEGTQDVTRLATTAVGSTLGCSSMLSPAFPASGNAARDIPAYAKFYESVFANCNDQYVVQHITQPWLGEEMGGPLDAYIPPAPPWPGPGPNPNPMPTPEQNAASKDLMGLYCQPLMEGNLSRHIYGGSKSFQDVGYDGKSTTLNPPRQPGRLRPGHGHRRSPHQRGRIHL